VVVSFSDQQKNRHRRIIHFSHSTVLAFPLMLYHVAVSGDTKMAGIIKSHVNNAADFNQALHAAARGGHDSMAEWLLTHGCDDPNTTDFAGNTPLQTAEKKGFREIAELLKKNGGK